MLPAFVKKLTNHIQGRIDVITAHLIRLQPVLANVLKRPVSHLDLYIDNIIHWQIFVLQLFNLFEKIVDNQSWQEEKHLQRGIKCSQKAAVIRTRLVLHHGWGGGGDNELLDYSMYRVAGLVIF